MAVKRLTKEERKRLLRDRQNENIKNKDSGGVHGKRVLNLSDYKDVIFYKPKKGTNRIDILPFIVSAENHPQKLKIGAEDYVLDIWVHGWVGPSDDSFVCLKRTYGKPCPICEEMSRLLQEENPNKKQIDSLKPKRRCYYNVIDLEDTVSTEKIKLFEVSQFLFEKELLEEAETAEDEVVYFSDLEEGRSIRFRASEEKMDTGKGFLKYKSFSFERRKKTYKESIFDQVFPLDALLIMPSYEEVKNSFFGIDENGETVEQSQREGDDEDRPNKETSSRKSSGAAKKEKCPHGYKFGVECDDFDVCADCDVWEPCADERDRLNENQ